MDLATKVLQEVDEEVAGILVRDDGNIHVFEDHADLYDVPLRSNDLYVVQPHGEILPPIALAVRQGVAKVTEGLFLHLDAHFDTAETQFYGADRRVTAVEASVLLDAFLRAEDDASAHEAFRKLSDYMKDDFEIFIRAMRKMIPNFAAFIRPDHEQLEDSMFIGPCDIDTYADGGEDLEPTSLSLAEIIARNRIAIYGIDTDFCGSTREGHEWEMEDEFKKWMDYLLEAFSVELARSGPDRKEGSDPIYMVSIDNEWCLFWNRFLRIFLNQHYSKIIEKTAAGKR